MDQSIDCEIVSVSAYAKRLNTTKAVLYKAIENYKLDTVRMGNKKMICLAGGRPSTLHLESFLRRKFGGLLTVKEIMGLFHVSRGCVLREIEKGALDAYFVPGEGYQVPLVAFLFYLDDGEGILI